MAVLGDPSVLFSMVLAFSNKSIKADLKRNDFSRQLKKIPNHKNLLIHAAENRLNI